MVLGLIPTVSQKTTKIPKTTKKQNKTKKEKQCNPIQVNFPFPIPSPLKKSLEGYISAEALVALVPFWMTLAFITTDFLQPCPNFVINANQKGTFSTT